MARPVSTTFTQEIRTFTVDNSLLKTLQTTTCPICIDECMLQDKIIRLYCHHVFHNKCILDWFSTNNTCPICRDIYPQETPHHHSVPINSQRHHLRLLKIPQVANRRDESVFRLHFHMRGFDSEVSLSSEPQKVLEKLLSEIGFPEIVKIAREPFWISVHDAITRHC
ncbi:Zinc finger, RING/FYVE/PHD-type [Artemisia annua]|uniref:Zinc finger, RING/FYVE/PHD-type n=1 Tax=Artemisia annua TaxID=35608 RepID=A0A2U1NR18_ARTAN|nr:Zinc finger, RING/FYVE/PHD-type [Artemisia annua]